MGDIDESQTTKDLGSTFLASINSAINDQSPRFSLEDIYTAIAVTNAGSILDPLDVLPILLPCPGDAAAQLIKIVGESCKAKEVVVAVQETMEHLINSIDVDEEDEDSRSASKFLPPSLQLERIVSTYGYVIPRLVQSSKPTFDTLSPLLRDLHHAIVAIAPSASPEDSRALVHSVSAFVQTIITHIQARGDDSTKLTECSDILFSLIDTTLSSNANSLETSIAYRIFESLSPKLVLRSAVNPDWERGEEVVSKALEAAKTLGFTIEALRKRPSIGSLILLSHSDLERCNHVELLQTFSSPIYTSIQTNIAFEETIAFLFKCFTLMARAEKKVEIPCDVAIPLSFVLPPLTSAHPKPEMRYCLLRLLSIVLSSFSPVYRLQVIEDVLTDTAAHAPQVRIAVVGLVKESVLEALSEGNKVPVLPEENAFGTSIFLDRLGSTLFRTDPPGLFQTPGFDAEDFLQSLEPRRLVECLGLYYVIIKRDRTNQTGIRDRNRILFVEKNLLHPLRQFLKETPDSHLILVQDMMIIVALQTSLQRVDEAVAELGLLGALQFDESTENIQ